MQGAGRKSFSVVQGLGAAVLAAAVIVLLYDGWQLIGGKAAEFTKVGYVWYALHPTSLQLLQPAIERHIEPYIGQWLWDPVMLTLLTTPIWLVLGIVGALLLLIGWRRRG